MAKPEWGTKRICQSCGARFYDLLRDPVICPKCGTQYDPDAVLRSRRARPVADTRPVIEDVEADVPEVEAEDDVAAIAEDDEDDLVADDVTDDADDAEVDPLLEDEEGPLEDDDLVEAEPDEEER